MTIEKVLAQLKGFRKYNNDVVRIVETQEQAATLALVDDLEEQFLLEQMLDEVKPNYRDNTRHRHYLISTPFRYPPLDYGSRFGDRAQPSYFYASESIAACMAEFAFYRFAFFDDSEPYDKAVVSEHMSFSVRATTGRASDLVEIDDAQLQCALRSPFDYALTQSLGRSLRQQDCVLIRFRSARSETGVNVAIAEPEVIVSEQPEHSQNWICRTTTSELSVSTIGQAPLTFTKRQFEIDGRMPTPAQ